MIKNFTLALCCCSALSVAQNIGITSFATGFSLPVEITNAGDSRLFVVQQGGTIKVVNPNGTVNATNFLTLPSTVVLSGGERGLLGLAFHPNYATNGYFYINYTRAGDGATVIARYSVSGNPNVADATSGLSLLTVDQPFSNHNGGTLKFGPDGYLYIGMGDGGSGGDPGNRAQNINENLGKMLRLDVDAASPYIPATNPYVGVDGNDEIWAIGMRNPWKFSFDKISGDLWIADVGQGAVEEINHVGSTAAALNYGWRCYEGNNVYTAGCAVPTTTYTFPVASYTHSGTGGCSVTGGYVYRGSLYPTLTGKYFFADYCLERLGTVTGTTIAYTGTISALVNVATFGQDIDGELYVASSGNGTIYKIVDTDLAVTDNLKNGFSMYPNPAASEVFLRSNSDSPLSHFRLYDLSGKLLMEQAFGDSDVYNIKTANLTTGLYFVTVENTAGARFSGKLSVK
jgi:glucose/arabinose dehydrogenase